MRHYNNEITAISINLDPAVKKLPYTPDIDIQEYVTVDQIIEETGLGPNGAIMEAADRMIDHIEDLKLEIEEYNDPDLVFIDTPGQMELFSFRKTGPFLANALGFGEAKRNVIFCYDSTLCARPNGFISSLLLATSVQYRFPNMPQINLLTKKDLVAKDKVDRILDWVEDEFKLFNDIDRFEKGMLKEFSIELSHLFSRFGAIQNLTPVSAQFNEGIDNVFGAIQQISEDDTSPYY